VRNSKSSANQPQPMQVDESPLGRSAALTSWLDRPLSGRACVLGWLFATAVFMALIAILGGPSEGDAAESLYSTWAIAHGHLACAYPPATTYNFPGIARPGPFIAPLWPLLSGAFGAITRIGHNVPFPSTAALGPHCSTATTAIYKWSFLSGSARNSVRLGYLSWLALMAGVIAMLRASGRGRCGWEPMTLVLMACVPAVWMPLVEFFHPQDIVAMGLALCGLACARRSWWVWAGVFLGLAIVTQQFALLVFAPLLMVAPPNRRLTFVKATIATAACVVVPFVALAGRRAIRGVLLGSGSSPGHGGSWLWELHLHGTPLLLASRVLPIVIAMALGRAATRRLGSAALEPVPLISLIAISLSLRLVFEQNFMGYYLMPLAVSLVLLDVVSGRVRGQLVAWLAALTLAFNPIPWAFTSNGALWGVQGREDLPLIFMTVALLLVISDVVRHRIRWYLVTWLVLIVLAFSNVPPWATTPLRHELPTWFWQVVLLATGIVLAAGPLLSSMRNRSKTPDDGHLVLGDDHLIPVR
jgi:hypothetical protein